ncbi:MAG TPA: DnaA regulatory inactivator Hda [Steroidobacteraceae bacterium]|jgi:DnaA family protein|nr:DnaA regulatory inactivator Hda [Steroidobacteraceae bacterium]
MDQLPLGLRLADRAVFDTFWPQGNEQLLAHLRSIAGGAMSGTTWLAGPHASGKSHLLQAACALLPAPRRCGYFPLRQLAALGPAALEGLPHLDLVCLDDVQQVAGQPQWEHALFGLYRELEERGGSLLVAAPEAPALIPWQLPDLGSRFMAAAIHAVRALDEGAQRAALTLRAKVRGFELPDEVARWLQRRYARDMGTLYQLLDTLDSAALVAQRRLTLPFIRSVLLARTQS